MKIFYLLLIICLFSGNASYCKAASLVSILSWGDSSDSDEDGTPCGSSSIVSVSSGASVTVAVEVEDAASFVSTFEWGDSSDSDEDDTPYSSASSAMGPSGIAIPTVTDIGKAHPTFIKVIDPILFTDPNKDIRRLCWARKNKIDIPVGAKIKPYLHESTWIMPPPLPKISTPFDILDLARPGETAFPYFVAYRHQLGKLLTEKNDKGETVLTHIINEKGFADILAFNFIMQHPHLYRIKGANNIWPIFLALDAEEKSKEKAGYTTVLLSVYKSAFESAGMSIRSLIRYFTIEKHPDSKLSINNRLLSLPDGAQSKKLYLHLLKIGGVELNKVKGL